MKPIFVPADSPLPTNLIPKFVYFVAILGAGEAACAVIDQAELIGPCSDSLKQTRPDLAGSPVVVVELRTLHQSMFDELAGKAAKKMIEELPKANGKAQEIFGDLVNHPEVLKAFCRVVISAAFAGEGQTRDIMETRMANSAEWAKEHKVTIHTVEENVKENDPHPGESA